MTRKYIILIITFILVLSAILVFNETVQYELAKRMNMISAGSYSFSESYKLPYSDINVIKCIKKFKEKNPKYQVPDVSISSTNSFKLEDSPTKNGLWFVAYLYDSNENRILKIAIRGNENNTTLEFVSINNGLEIGHWKDINRDFSYDENEQLKNTFEKFYLNPIQHILKDK